MKKLLVIAVATALIAPAAAMADTTLYGKLHATVGNVETTKGAVESSETVVESHSSRLGVKGSTELDNGLSATYGLEYGIDLDGDNEKNPSGCSDDPASATKCNAQSRGLSARNTFVGLKGGFGEVRVGRHDTPAKLATAGLDAFADTYADMGNIIAADNHRVDNAVAYITKVGPVGLAATHSTETDLLGGDGDRNGGTTANTVMANYSNGPIYAALGYTTLDTAPSEMTVTNLGAGYKAEAGHFANVVYETSESATGTEDTNVYVAGGFKTGAATLKAGYGKGETDGAGEEEQTTVGVDYSLGKKTSAYLLWNDNTNTGRVATGAESSTTATAVGLVTEF
ncbi:Outer membrane protein (porin) [Thiothrix caldifontis]|uniref:Outer membrane protein (Porin) n=1 Tax=Thiothrix caldifontis TaxID=525918 RepID=A0A1H3VJT3_9GAMM|nr:porin [Thiothrix caldifontis]SDZ74362.1 Outer membrane protein (porin) [Thiothrix caldifontis]